MTGLTDEQVNARIAEGKVNADENPNTRTYKQIVRENTLTFFNFLNLVLLVLVLLVGSYKNAFFVCIIIINTLIGIAQEIRAKKQSINWQFLQPENPLLSVKDRNGPFRRKNWYLMMWSVLRPVIRCRQMPVYWKAAWK